MIQQQVEVREVCAVGQQSMDRLFRVVWSAFALNAVTGTMLFIADAGKRAPQPIFWIKLTCVAIGLTTAVLIRRAHFDGCPEPGVIGRQARRLAVISLGAWCAAITAGRLLAYVGG